MVDHHIRPLYEVTTDLFRRLVEQGAVPDIPAPFLYYLLTGAGPNFCAGADLKAIAAGRGTELGTADGGFAGWWSASSGCSGCRGAPRW